MLVILKIPVVYLCAVVWWAIRAEPRPLEGAGRCRPPSARPPATGAARGTGVACGRCRAAGGGRYVGAASVARARALAARPMSSVPERGESRPSDAREAVAGLLAAAAIFASAIGVAYRPVRLIPVAVVLVLVAARMTTRYAASPAGRSRSRSSAGSLGMAIAVITEDPLY